LDVRVSDDIKAVIDWEIANNGNSVEAVYYRSARLWWR
jgi:hypothetical protein